MVSTLLPFMRLSTLEMASLLAGHCIRSGHAKVPVSCLGTARASLCGTVPDLKELQRLVSCFTKHKTLAAGSVLLFWERFPLGRRVLQKFCKVGVGVWHGG